MLSLSVAGAGATPAVALATAGRRRRRLWRPDGRRRRAAGGSAVMEAPDARRGDPAGSPPEPGCSETASDLPPARRAARGGPALASPPASARARSRRRPPARRLRGRASHAAAVEVGCLRRSAARESCAPDRRPRSTAAAHSMPRSRRSFARYFSLGLALFCGLVTTGAKQRPTKGRGGVGAFAEVLQKLSRASFQNNRRGALPPSAAPRLHLLLEQPEAERPHAGGRSRARSPSRPTSSTSRRDERERRRSSLRRRRTPWMTRRRGGAQRRCHRRRRRARPRGCPRHRGASPRARRAPARGRRRDDNAAMDALRAAGGFGRAPARRRRSMSWQPRSTDAAAPLRLALRAVPTRVGHAPCIRSRISACARSLRARAPVMCDFESPYAGAATLLWMSRSILCSCRCSRRVRRR